MLAGAVFLVLLIAATNVAASRWLAAPARTRDRCPCGARASHSGSSGSAAKADSGAFSGLLGLLLALAAIRFIVAVKPGNLARLNEVSLDPYVFGCALGALPPHRSPGWTDAGDNHGEGGVSDHPARKEAGVSPADRHASSAPRPGSDGILHWRLFCLPARSLLRSLWSAQNVNLGFRPERVLLVALSITPSMAASQAD